MMRALVIWVAFLPASLIDPASSQAIAPIAKTEASCKGELARSLSQVSTAES